jgi:prevent-host-death family protein
MIFLSVSDLRNDLAERINQVAYQQEIIVLTRSGKILAALVPVDSLPKRLREAIEDASDVEAAKIALAESDERIPYEGKKNTTPWMRYTYDKNANNAPPLKKPKRGEDSLQMLDRLGLNNFPDEALEAAGFKGYDPGELFYSCLAEPWKGHPEHARVISSSFAQGFTFAVEMPESPQARAGRAGGSKTSEAKREAARRNIQKRWDRERNTGAISVVGKVKNLAELQARIKKRIASLSDHKRAQIEGVVADFANDSHDPETSVVVSVIFKDEHDPATCAECKRERKQKEKE